MNIHKLVVFVRQSDFRKNLLFLAFGIVCGILLWNGFIISLEKTSTTEFCTSCHSMGSYIYPAYQRSIHYRNSKGIQAGCSDCHIPKPLGAKVIRKTIGLKDIYHTLAGTIDTPEKYAEKKTILEERVRKRMRGRDSSECRNCHRLQNMDYARQSAVASKQHQDAQRLNKTCIDCHQGVGHPSRRGYIEKNDDDTFSLD